MGRLASVPAFFGLRVASALLLLKLSASFLPVGGFAVFSQLMLFAAVINLLAVGGAQNGVLRQAAAARDPQELSRIQAAAFAIWGAVLAVAAVPVALLSPWVSRILVGTPGDWPAVVLIAMAALAAGPGQIWCAILTGRGQAARSLAAQAFGLIAGASAAAWLIVRGEAAAATIAFACGPLATMAAAFLLSRRLRTPWIAPWSARPHVGALLRYSAAFAATTGFSSVVLFGLRSLYRDAFGANELGYWIAANRVSDMSTQLLGLFMIQLYVPQAAMTLDEVGRRALLLRAWGVAFAVMASFLAVFSLASRPLIHLFLSDAFLPAATAIRTYMTGDMLRVWPCLAMYTAFAGGSPGRYAGIEMGTVAVMAVITLGLTAAGDVHAPMLGYVGAYGLAAVLVTIAFFWRRRAAVQAAA